MNTFAARATHAPADIVVRHRLPPLLYAMDALEPCIDARTMTLHRDVHHAAYVDDLNAALAELPQLHDASALWLLCNLTEVPRESRAAVHHSAGGHVNHSLFWQAMTPDSIGEPVGSLRDALCRAFGSVERFKERFEAAGRGLFGSGWVWLVTTRGAGGRLEITTTVGHDNPAQEGLVPVLLNDVWEHAYYLRYRSGRAEYLRAWWTIVDWTEANRRFEERDGRGQPR